MSFNNFAINHCPSDLDFTVENYRKLLTLAKNNWNFESFDEIPWGTRFCLWRHDIDLSLSRALVLAHLEKEEGLSATYFVNPHSEFYNISEAEPYRIIGEILSLGHHLGLHFDGAFYDIQNEMDLDRIISFEANQLESLFGVSPVAFSFHNPVASDFECDAERYGGLQNCYSKRLRSQVGYCSDSNGYWRFRRLEDVLVAQEDHALQVLTHPGWWYGKPMPSRQRVFTSVYERAESTMRRYDSLLDQPGRVNHEGPCKSLRVLEGTYPEEFNFYTYLWNKGKLETLFLELWRFHEKQIQCLITAYLRKEWNIPSPNLDKFFGDRRSHVDGCKLFMVLFNQNFTKALGVGEMDYKICLRLRNQISYGRILPDVEDLDKACVYLCDLIQKLECMVQCKSAPCGSKRQSDNKIRESTNDTHLLWKKFLLEVFEESRR